MARPKIQSSIQLIRLWFEFYKLALRDSSLKENIKKSKKYYESWGNVKSKKFDAWFLIHEHLFTTKVEEIKEMPKHHSTINISIPLNQPIKRSIEEVRKILSIRKKEINPSGYNFTKGKRIFGPNLYQILLFYTIWLDLNKPPINYDFISNVFRKLKNRPKSHWVPYIIQTEPKRDKNGFYLDDKGNLLRSVRRYIDQGKKVCHSVSLGEFPGRSTLNK
jgi:hypothetical protein